MIAPIFTNEKGLFLQTIYYPLQLFANNSYGSALELLVEAPSYESKHSSKTPYLDVSAAYDEGKLVLNVVNRHLTDTIPVTFELEDKDYSGAFQVSEVNGPDIKAQNTFGFTTVKTVSKPEVTPQRARLPV